MATVTAARVSRVSFWARLTIGLSLFIVFGFAQFALRGFVPYMQVPIVFHVHGAAMLAWLGLGAGLALSFVSVFGGFATDDHNFRLLFQGAPGAQELARPPWEVFSFFLDRGPVQRAAKGFLESQEFKGPHGKANRALVRYVKQHERVELQKPPK